MKRQARRDDHGQIPDQALSRLKNKESAGLARVQHEKAPYQATSPTAERRTSDPEKLLDLRRFRTAARNARTIQLEDTLRELGSQGKWLAFTGCDFRRVPGLVVEDWTV